MSVRKILTTDSLNFGFRLKYNETVDEIISSGSINNGNLILQKSGGGDITISLASIVNSIIRSSGNVSATEGVQDISFSSPLSSTNYSLSIFDINGLGIQITEQTIDGFTINALTAGIFNYIAILNI